MNHSTYKVGISSKKLVIPSGHPMGGYSIYGKYGQGSWSELQLSVTLIDDIIWIIIDWWTASTYIKKRIYERLKKLNPDVHYQNIILSCNHTHHTPGNIDESTFYNRYATMNKGFNLYIADYLVDSTLECYEASLNNVYMMVLTHTQTIIKDIVKNRSIVAYSKNNTTYQTRMLGLDEICEPNDLIVSCLSFIKLGEKIPCHFILHLPSHPTMNGCEFPFYSPDVFGVVKERLRQVICQNNHIKHKNDIIISVLNGASGDVTFFSTYTLSHTIEVGEKIANQLYSKLFAYPSASSTVNGNVVVSQLKQIYLPRYEIDILKYKSHFVSSTQSTMYMSLQENDVSKYVRLSEKGLPGFSQIPGADEVGGANSNNKLIKIFYGKGKKTIFKNGPHGSKRDVIDFTYKGILTPILRYISSCFVSDIPKTVEMGYVQIGNFYLYTTPFEITRMVEYNCQELFDSYNHPPTPQKLQKNKKNMWVLSHTNHYLSYCTTEEEYECQLYEGASTLYGKYMCYFIYDVLNRFIKNIKPDENELFNTIYTEYRNTITPYNEINISFLFEYICLQIKQNDTLFLFFDMDRYDDQYTLYNNDVIENYYKFTISNQSIGIIWMSDDKYEFDCNSRHFFTKEIDYRQSVKPNIYKLKYIDTFTKEIVNLSFPCIDELKNKIILLSTHRGMDLKECEIV